MATETHVARRPVLAALPRITGLLTRVIGYGLVALVLIWLAYNFYKTPAQFVSVLLTGITVGSIYALVAMGYTLVYGIIELINFAHGDVFMWGTLIALWVGADFFGLDGSQNGLETTVLVIVTMICCMAFCGTLNMAIERLAYKPLRNAPRLAPLITAIGMSFILQNIAAAITNFRFQSVGDIFPTTPLFYLGGVPYRAKSLIVVLLTIPVLLILVYLVRRTRAGKAMRATAQDMDAARMLGIDVDRTISFTFALGGALAGAGGLLFLYYFTQTRYDLGFVLGLFAFTAAVLGGIGNLTGAFLGAMLIGLIQNFNEGLSYGAPGSDWTESIVFGILILILVFRPQGLLGEQTADRA
jgi:branched-chain amino acid transport system permease protein